MSYFIFKNFVFNSVFVIFCGSVMMVMGDENCDADVENILETLISPSQTPSIQVQALRRDIFRRLREALQRQELEDELLQYKRSYSSLAQWNNFPTKRSLQALARAGYIRTRTDDNDPNLKRSIATLAKNGQLPNYHSDDVDKRGLESLARNGDLHSKREIQQLIEDLYDKRNIGSLARNYNFPSRVGKRYVPDFRPLAEEKRSIASLARDGMKVNGKRNVAALLRQDSFLNGRKDGDDGNQTDKPDGGMEAEKRNIGSIKAQYKPKYKRSTEKNEGRPKREANYYDYTNDEYSLPIYQNQNAFDYDDYVNDISEQYPVAEKRFLGRLPQMGKAKTTPSPKIRFQ